MKKIVFILFISLGLQFNFLTGQNGEIDSLKALLKNSVSNDTTTVKIADKLSVKLMSGGNLDSALHYSEIASNLCMELADEEAKNKALSVIYNNKGYIYEYKGEYDMAINYYTKALEINEKLNDEYAIATTLTYLGLVYAQINIPRAFANYFKALPLYEKLCSSPDPKMRLRAKKGVSAIYNNLGITFLNQNDYKKALEFNYKALRVNTELNNYEWEAKNYSNLGLVYSNLGKYDSALYYTNRAIKIEKELGLDLGSAYHALGGIYTYKKEFTQALEYYFKAMDCFQRKSFKLGIAVCYGNIGAIYFGQKKYKIAEEVLLKSLSLSKEIGGWGNLREVNLHLSDLCTETNRAKEALEYYKNYVLAKDSLVNEENTKKTVQQQMQYEFDKKEAAAKMEQEKRDAISSAESRKQKIIIAAVSTGLVFILILSFVILRSLRINQKKNRIISQQKKVVELQKELVEEKQREILDSIHYAKRIQMALMPQEKYISKKIKKL